MDSLLKRILEEITRPNYKKLSIVCCSDGFLQREDTIRAFSEQAGVTMLCFSQLELRIWYETAYQKQADKQFVIILENTDRLISDIVQHAYITEFKTRDLLLTYTQQAIDLSKMNYQMLAHLFENKSVAIKDLAATCMAVGEAETRFGKDGEDISVVKESLMSIVMDWQHPQKTIEDVSHQIVKAAKHDKFAEIEPEMTYINLSFQKHLDDVYYQQLVTAAGPKVVHKILPYMARTYGIGQKVALVVVDGMSYWQYLVLRQSLNDADISTNDNVCYAWIPSVTQLSRQAIFRGTAPDRNYRQNPANEEKLWREYWYGRNFKEWHVMYAHESLPHIPESVERLAFVTMTIDDDMHNAHNMKQLYRSTEDWAQKFVSTIQQIRNAGFDIILTADHGGVPSFGWGSLNQSERSALYETGSRGQRHLIFSNQDTMQYFLNKHKDVNAQWLIHGDHVVWRENKCFGTSSCITHGGSHVLEMLVPLVTIKI